MVHELCDELLADHAGRAENADGNTRVCHVTFLSEAIKELAAWWARGEPSRAGAGVVVVAGLTCTAVAPVWHLVVFITLVVSFALAGLPGAALSGLRLTALS